MFFQFIDKEKEKMDDVSREDLILLLEKQENCDIVFKLNGNISVKAHSDILSSK